jgi:prevent-host-death family protein
MRQMPAGVFKARCLAVMKQIQSTGEPVVVTRRGSPVVKVVPVEQENDSIFGFMRGKGIIVGDIESPIPLDEWKVLKIKKARKK